jgi:EAL domain-containing protein (putative c-di-GMP-specific phosphodiesterase class I)
VFIRNIHLDEIDRAMAQSICDVGHTMGLKIVAEFVENKQIMDILKAMGIDFAQGFIWRNRNHSQCFNTN